jgi:hypothetical protein
MEHVGSPCRRAAGRFRPISGKSVRFHLIVLVLTFEPVVVVSAGDALPVL